MTFTVLPDMVSFGEIFAEVELAKPYNGPPPPRYNLRDGKVRRSILGVSLPNGVFMPNDDDPFVRFSLAYEIWRRDLRKIILDVLVAKGEHVTLAMDDPNMPPKSIDSRALGYVDASQLAVSMFDPLDYRLEALRPYDGARIFMSDAAANAIRTALKPPSAKGGRPEHPAKAWYAARSFKRNGLSMKKLQNEMKDATGMAPPSTSAIRQWEKAAGENSH